MDIAIRRDILIWLNLYVTFSFIDIGLTILGIQRSAFSEGNPLGLVGVVGVKGLVIPILSYISIREPEIGKVILIAGCAILLAAIGLAVYAIGAV